ncbi:MAG: M91 family zinc metallopeptidase [Acidobacteriota bacterium]
MSTIQNTSAASTTTPQNDALLHTPDSTTETAAPSLLDAEAMGTTGPVRDYFDGSEPPAEKMFASRMLGEHAERGFTTVENGQSFSRNTVLSLDEMEIYSEQSVSPDTTWLVVDAGDGADEINMSQDARGDILVDVNGEAVRIPAQYRFNLKLRGGDGDDTIRADSSFTGAPDAFSGQGSVVFEGNAGNDLLIGGDNSNDTMIGGDGDDRIFAGGGNDYVSGDAGDDIIDGGAGRDFLHGVGGADQISGGDGRDWIDGGRGNDVVSGDGGNDTVIGGRDNDQISGGDGNDVLVAGFDSPSSDIFTVGDVMDGGAGIDRLIDNGRADLQNLESIDEVRTVDPTETNFAGTLPGDEALVIYGSPEFVQRMEADLDTMRSTESGRAILEALDESGREMIIIENENNGHNVSQNAQGVPRELINERSVAVVRMDPEGYDLTVGAPPNSVSEEDARWTQISTATVLQHELVHALDFARGNLSNATTNGTPNDELRAVGIPYNQDFDGIPDPTPAEYLQFSENAHRAELGLPFRPWYSGPQDHNNVPGDPLAAYREDELPGVAEERFS